MNDFYKKTTAKKNQYFLALICGLFLLSSFSAAQNLPNEIRGYKVYKAKILIKNKTGKSAENSESESKGETEAFININKPEIIDVSLTGVTFELAAKINAFEQSGTVDFLTFKDFRVNDLAVSVEEYKESFKFQKNQPVALPKPIKIFVGAGQTLRGVLSEFRDSQEEWKITGTVFVFGRFKKSFLTFKRVVPVEINLKIKNPLKNKIHDQKLYQNH